MKKAKIDLKSSKPVEEAKCISLTYLGIKSYSEQGQVTTQPELIQNQSGQVIVEYILLLFISVSVATFLTTKLISRNTDNPGIITSAWNGMNQAIGQDIVE